jgi:hypothetical protein
MSSTIVSNRCKGCVFWQHYVGGIENPIMRKLHGQMHAPARKPHACQLFLRDTDQVDDDGETIKVSVFPVSQLRDTDEPGPRFGHRIGPNGTCKYHRAKHGPYRKPKPTVHVGVEHVFDHTFADVPIPARIADIKPHEKSLEMVPVSVILD